MLDSVQKSFQKEKGENSKHCENDQRGCKVPEVQRPGENRVEHLRGNIAEGIHHRQKGCSCVLVHHPVDEHAVTGEDQIPNGGKEDENDLEDEKDAFVLRDVQVDQIEDEQSQVDEVESVRHKEELRVVFEADFGEQEHEEERRSEGNEAEFRNGVFVDALLKEDHLSDVSPIGWEDSDQEPEEDEVSQVRVSDEVREDFDDVQSSLELAFPVVFMDHQVRDDRSDQNVNCLDHEELITDAFNFVHEVDIEVVGNERANNLSESLHHRAILHIFLSQHLLAKSIDRDILNANQKHRHKQDQSHPVNEQLFEPLVHDLGQVQVVDKEHEGNDQNVAHPLAERFIVVEVEEGRENELGVERDGNQLVDGEVVEVDFLILEVNFQGGDVSVENSLVGVEEEDE